MNTNSIKLLAMYVNKGEDLMRNNLLSYHIEQLHLNGVHDFCRDCDKGMDE